MRGQALAGIWDGRASGYPIKAFGYDKSRYMQIPNRTMLVYFVLFLFAYAASTTFLVFVENLEMSLSNLGIITGLAAFARNPSMALSNFKWTAVFTSSKYPFSSLCVV